MRISMPVFLVSLLALTGCTTEAMQQDSAPGPASEPWAGPTSFEWGPSVSSNAFILEFGQTWDVHGGYAITVNSEPRFGAVENDRVDVAADFQVTKIKETNDSPDLNLGWTAGNEPSSETLYRPEMNCGPEEIRMDQTVICVVSFTAAPGQVTNFSWRIGMHDAAAWPAQTADLATK